jgi:hypothetical protein
MGIVPARVSGRITALETMGFTRCTVDHAIFIYRSTTPPSVAGKIPESGELLIYIALHVDDGLTVTNSPSGYTWFISELRKSFETKDLGVAENGNRTRSFTPTALVITSCVH